VLSKSACPLNSTLCSAAYEVSPGWWEVTLFLGYKLIGFTANGSLSLIYTP